MSTADDNRTRFAGFQRSALVVGHPDDEILWFSSVFQEVDQIFLCYETVPSNIDWSAGRSASLTEYPLENISSFELVESEMINCAAWPNPEVSREGLGVVGDAAVQYRENYDRLLNQLETRLRGYQTVFTHNPWGEYGHEEHVQVFNAVRAVQSILGYDIWVSNYVSNKSISLMQQRLSLLSNSAIHRPTKVADAHTIRDLYQRNRCWTWYDDYEWFPEESMIKLRRENVDDSAFEGCELEAPTYGKQFPLNLLHIWVPKEKDQRSRARRAFDRLISR